MYKANLIEWINFWEQGYPDKEGCYLIQTFVDGPFVYNGEIFNNDLTICSVYYWNDKRFGGDYGFFYYINGNWEKLEDREIVRYCKVEFDHLSHDDFMAFYNKFYKGDSNGSGNKD